MTYSVYVTYKVEVEWDKPIQKPVHKLTDDEILTLEEEAEYAVFDWKFDAVECDITLITE